MNNNMFPLVEITFLIAGWLLGLLSSILFHWITFRSKTRRFRKTLSVELGELCFKLTSVAYRLTAKFGNLDRDFMIWYVNSERAYEGPNITKDDLQLLEKLETLNDEQLGAWQTIEKSKGSAVSLKKYGLPYLSSQMGMISALPQATQAEIVEILAQLSMMHEEMDTATYHFQRTQDSGISPENHKICVENLENGYRYIAKMAQSLADRILKAKKGLV